MQMLKRWNVPQTRADGHDKTPPFQLSKKMTSPHMVAVIDLSLESDGWLRGGNGEGICTEQQQSASVMFSMANLIQSRG